MNNDITALLYRIKENIRTIEEGNASDALLDEVNSDFLGMLELIKLFLISERDTYYGYFLMNLQFRPDFTCKSIAGIKLNEFPPVFVSNPLLLCKFTLKEIIYIVCHELDHIVFNHPAEMMKVNPEADEQTFYEFNLAADAAVNDRIKHEIQVEGHGFMAPPESIITSSVLARMYGLKNIHAMEHYAYYYSLIHEKEQKNSLGSGLQVAEDGQLENGQSAMMQGQNEKDGMEGKPQEQSDGESEAEAPEGIVTASNCGQLEDHDWEAGEDAEEAAAAVKELVNAAVDMMNNETRGMMPGSFMSQVEKINEPPALSWEAVLKKYVGTISASKRKTRMRLNRRQPERFDLSGRMDDKVLKIVVAIDTSASVDDARISQILNEIFAILAKRKHDITIIECDSDVQRVYRARKPSDIENKVQGRGGTLFTPVIEYINNDKYYRDALLIYFTDGFGERKIPRPRTYRNIWVIFDDERHLSLEEPYGVVLKL